MPRTPEERVGWVVRMRGGEVAFIKSYDSSHVSSVWHNYVLLARHWMHEYKCGETQKFEWELLRDTEAWLIPPHRDQELCTRLQDAILCGHEACVRALAPRYKNYEEVPEMCVRDAAAYGHLDVLRCLVVDMGWPMDGRSIWAAARAGRLECVKFAMENRIPTSFDDVRDLMYGKDFIADVGTNRADLFWDHQYRCNDYVNTLRTVDGFLRDVAPLLDYPEYSSKMCELDKSVLRLMRSKFYTEYPYLEGRPARLPRMLRRSRDCDGHEIERRTGIHTRASPL